MLTYASLWITCLVGDDSIGIYHLGEMVQFNDKLCNKKVSKYYIVDNGSEKYIPIHKVNGYNYFKATVAFKGVTKHYVHTQDAYMLICDKVMKVE